MIQRCRICYVGCVENEREKQTGKKYTTAGHRVALTHTVVTPEETSVGRHGNTRALPVTLTFGVLVIRIILLYCKL